MKRDPRSTSRLKRLKPRQRKKLRVGEFKEHSFDVELVFHSPMRGEPYHDFINDFFGFLEERACWAAASAARSRSARPKA
jgi:uncharacterized protein YggL (DUF469 family)